MLHRPVINTGGAQLVFTSHDTWLLDVLDLLLDLFRRDQVWFAEKDRDQASTLVSLSEFSPRKNVADQAFFGLPRLQAMARNCEERTGFESIHTHFIGHPIAHRPVSALAFFPHPQQCRVTGINEVDDAHIGFGGVLAVQSARVLLQRSFP